jgi:hypothetical protein
MLLGVLKISGICSLVPSVVVLNGAVIPGEGLEALAVAELAAGAPVWITVRLGAIALASVDAVVTFTLAVPVIETRAVSVAVMV